jgi:FKBP-type peptidyl-prolyl cis-trans isomerase 2
MIMAIKEGDKVKVEYTGTLDDGTVFDTSEGKAPLEFEVGTGKVIKGFNDAILSMEKGEEKSVKIESKDAYGDYNPQLIKKIPKDQLPQDQEPKEGMILMIKTPQGQKFPARIKEVSDKEITVDLNSPLAGKNLNFKLKVVDVS